MSGCRNTEDEEKNKRRNKLGGDYKFKTGQSRSSEFSEIIIAKGFLLVPLVTPHDRPQRTLMLTQKCFKVCEELNKTIRAFARL